MANESITFWNRIEGSQRAPSLDRALRAEIRDPLWLISKQWQMGEYKGEDAGSAIVAKVHVNSTRISKFIDSDALASEYNHAIPLEAQAEKTEIPFDIAEHKYSYDIRLMMGRYWIKLLTKHRFKSIVAKFKQEFPIDKPNNEASHSHYCAHKEVQEYLRAIQGRFLDGFDLYTRLKQEKASNIVMPQNRSDELDLLGKKFVTWFEHLIWQPTHENGSNWNAEQLEYRFGIKFGESNGEKHLGAKEYFHGNIDWFNLDSSATTNTTSNLPTAEEEALTLTFFPSPITFPGMPEQRWWALEDGQANFLKIQPDTTDINQLLVLDFALHYSHDWFILPLTLPIGSFSKIEGLMITNVFGENLWISAAGNDPGTNWHRWTVFNNAQQDSMGLEINAPLFLPPSCINSQEGSPMEEVFFVRDEIANMVFAIEANIQLPNGNVKRGKEAGEELKEYLQKFIPIVEPQGIVENDAKFKYNLVNALPEHWIPFIPVLDDAGQTRVKLQRASFPRIYDNADKTQLLTKIEPRTTILREGLDTSDANRKYFIDLKEISRMGVRVSKSHQRTRWVNGEVINWIGLRKSTGKGEGSSGLAFDQIVPKGKREDGS